MMERYRRSVPALSEEECALLKTKRVLIVGCGGIGGHLLDQLLRIGVGTIRICDDDVFEPSNLNRQLLSDMTTMGISKAEAAVLYCQRVNPEAMLEHSAVRMTCENVSELIRDCDAVLDGLDNVESRKILARACAQAKIPYIFGAIQGWTAQAAVCMPGDTLMDTLYSENAVIQDNSVLSFTPALCASIQTALCVKLLTGRPAKFGKLYHFDLLNLEFDTISLT